MTDTNARAAHTDGSAGMFKPSRLAEKFTDARTSPVAFKASTRNPPANPPSRFAQATIGADLLLHFAARVA